MMHFQASFFFWEKKEWKIEKEIDLKNFLASWQTQPSILIIVFFNNNKMNAKFRFKVFTNGSKWKSARKNRQFFVDDVENAKPLKSETIARIGYSFLVMLCDNTFNKAEFPVNLVGAFLNFGSGFTA